MLIFGAFGHAGGDGSDQAVAEKNAEKRADESSGDFVTDFFGRSAEAGERVGHGGESPCL